MQIIQDYRALHAIPELDRILPKTLAYVQSQLQPLRCRVFSPAQGALCAYFSFGKEKTIAFRADMDALPVLEKTGLPYSSRHEGAMHACGHDGHTAILLELARRIHRCEDMAHNILLIFQPAEETTGGAEDICKAGILEQYRVAYIFALHLWPGLEKGQLFSKPGFLMSRCTGVEVSFKGLGGHIADSRPGADALRACCSFYHRTSQIQEQSPYLLKFGSLTGGTAGNVLCSKAKLSGSLRTFREETDRRIRTTLASLCHQVAEKNGCRGKIFFRQGYPAVCNHSGLWKNVQRKCPVRKLDRAFWTAEDFSFYQQRIPGIYLLLGLGDTPPLHSPEFSFDEKILSAGADYFFRLCREF